jgi:hypothetical protein
MLHKITPVILSYHKEPNLARVLKRLAWAKRVMLLDGLEVEDQQFPVTILHKSGARHEQHPPDQRFSLFPPADEQTSPKRYQYAGCHRTKDLAKVQTASADMLNRASWKGLLISDYRLPAFDI